VHERVEEGRSKLSSEQRILIQETAVSDSIIATLEGRPPTGRLLQYNPPQKRKSNRALSVRHGWTWSGQQCFFGPAPQESNRVADARARTIHTAADQLELRDKPVIAFHSRAAASRLRTSGSVSRTKFS